MTEPARRLVIAYAFPPYSDTSATVAAKRVLERGERVDVIQNAMDEMRSRDDHLDEIAGHLVARRSILETVTRFSVWHSIEPWCAEGRAQVQRWVDESAARGELVAGGSLPWTSLYSRAHFIASHILAGLVKQDHPQLHWDVEFSDPCSRDVTGAERHTPVSPGELFDEVRRAVADAGFTPPETDNAFVWAEYLGYCLGDEIHFTNENQADYMIGFIEDPRLAERVRQRMRIAPHPTPPQEFYHRSEARLDTDPDRINIAYFGNVYGTRSLSPVLDGMAALPESDRRRLTVHVFTSDPEDVARLVADRGIADAVKVGPYAQYFDFLALTTQADLLLAVDASAPSNATRSPFLMSKWSDYQGSGTPVWLMEDPTSPLASSTHPALVLRTPAGHGSAAAQALARLARSGLPSEQVAVSAG
ncbi:hypothetical protein OO014_09930 [Intrasporangium calvum]|uniref:Glycosyltransferase n=1 Tax=Intrasporangium calvum TaxID=53358 RepID=A0ABT5GIR5_9MICO|nr:hypothetical protein [Intrasporangium calvum]MDC5697576.1 hypothetical protein [Intrasporangium calvum]